MARDTWRVLEKDIDSATDDPAEVKRQLAYHTWCDLFLAIADTAAVAQQALDEVPESVRLGVRASILGSSQQSGRPRITGAIVDLLVEHALRALVDVATGQVSGLEGLRDEDLVRYLRMLAVFCCPTPVKHKEVRTRALEPLGEDVHELLRTETKHRLEQLFAA